MKTKDIEKSPIYNMSMCSLENFHTCFLKWLGNVYPKETMELFLNNINEENIKFKDQEKENDNRYDLCAIKDNGEKILIIENKIKSYPTEEQIKKYQEANKKVPLILLSLVPADNINLPEECKLTYDELAKRMHKKFDNKNFSTEEKYNEYLIKDYISVIESLAGSFPKIDSEKYDFNNGDIKIPDDFKDIYKKYRMSKLKEFVKQKLKSQGIDLKEGDEIATDFSRKTAILNVIACKKFQLGEKALLFRIQIQGRQYRYSIIYGNENDDKLRVSIASKLAENNLWFIECKEKYPNAKNYKDKGFCGYKPSIIYRYKYRPINETWSYEQVADAIATDIKKLNTNRNKIEETISECIN